MAGPLGLVDAPAYRRIKDLLLEALEQEPGQRAGFLAARCGGDAALRRSVEELLRAHEDSDGFLEPSTGPAAAPPSLVGTRVGSIRLTRRLGQGGMGEVYAGLDEKLRREVAVKCLHARQRLSSGAKERFLREARLLSALEHPNICQIHGLVEEEGGDFLVLELVRGRTLDEASPGLERGGKLRLAAQVADALGAAHARGVVHRDLKPDNVIVTPEGDAKVLDFGIARSLDGTAPVQPEEADAARLEMPARFSTIFLTQQGTIAGTPRYMSPEQARGDDAAAPSDVYSLGLVLQELFTGRPARDAALTAAELLGCAASGESAPAKGLDRDLGALIERLKAPEPEARPTAAETAARLRWIAEAPRRRLRRAAVAAAIAALALAGGKYTYDLDRERAVAVAERQRAVEARQEAEDVLDFLVGLFELADPAQAGRPDLSARELIDEGARRLDHQLAERPGVRARLRHTLGRVYSRQSLPHQAAGQLEQALAERRRLLPADHPAIADSALALGDAYRRLDRYDESRPLVEEAVRIYEGSLGAEAPELAPALYVLALLDHGRWGVDRALPIYERAVRILERARGPEHADLAEPLIRIAQIHEVRGELARAEDTSRRAWSILRQSLGDEHPRTLWGLKALGMILSVAGRFDEALELLERHQRIALEVLGPEHRDTLHGMSVIADIDLELGRYDEAERSLRSQLDAAEKLGGLPNSLVYTWCSLAEVHLARGELDEAEELFRRSLDLRRSFLEEGNPDPAWNYEGLGRVHAARGELDQAEALLRQGLELRDTAIGPDHLLVARSLHLLANFYRDHGRFDEAEPLYRRALEIRGSIVDPRHPALQRLREDHASLSRAVAPPRPR